jgi:hypothetical protein
MSRYRYPVKEDLGECFRLAKEAIEKSLKDHQELVSRRNNPLVGHVPRLVDLAAERLGSLSAKDSDSLDDIPPVILGLHIWKWHKVSYAAFRRGLQSLLSDPDFTKREPGDLDEW